MASIIINGNTSGGITLSAPDVAGSNTQTLVAATGTLAPLVAGTAVSASGTSVDFTGIPSWVKRITVMFSGVSTNGTSVAQLQLGTSGGIQSTGYAGSTNVTSSAATTTSVITSGIALYGSFSAVQSLAGSVVLTLLDSASGIWSASVILARTDAASAGYGGWVKTLSGTLDRIRITTVNGTDTFDAGSINILYE